MNLKSLLKAHDVPADPERQKQKELSKLREKLAAVQKARNTPGRKRLIHYDKELTPLEAWPAGALYDRELMLARRIAKLEAE